MIDLSIVIPTIRTEGWYNVISAIEKSCSKYSWEIIFVGPYYDSCIELYTNVKYVRDFGSPNRAQQIGLVLAEGKFVTCLVDDYDDGPNHIDAFLDIISETDEETVVIGNYDENGEIAVEDFSVRHCYGGGSSVDPSWVIFNVVFLHRTFLEKMGGFDCSYNVTCFGHTDLAIRCQSYGCKVINANLKIGGVIWIRDTTGDHEPIHNNQVYRDQPMFNEKTSSPIETSIGMDNWKDSPPVWERFV
jgi:hypothetical protein|tara:strand:+ start:1190 stop:1924 length:735 start_codon:yes stop_codon:yes gene_type:complete